MLLTEAMAAHRSYRKIARPHGRLWERLGIIRIQIVKLVDNKNLTAPGQIPDPAPREADDLNEAS
jgi:hypothetical protein